MADQNDTPNQFAFPEPQAEHKWLEQMVGEWEVEMTATCTPDGEPMTHTGTDRVRMIGNLWIIGEQTSALPDGAECQNILTLGYDPARKLFVGSYLVGIMPHQWIYEGSLSEDGKSVILNTTGPDMNGGPDMGHYQDIFTIVSPDHRKLTSRAKQPDGSWNEFMEANYHRVK